MKVGTNVLALVTLHEDDEDYEVCRPGDRGVVIAVEDGVPLVRFARTGFASIVDPNTEVVRSRGEQRFSA